MMASNRFFSLMPCAFTGLLHVAQCCLYLNRFRCEQRKAVVEHDVVRSGRKVPGHNFCLCDPAAVVVSAGRMPVLEISEPVVVENVAVDVVTRTSGGCKMTRDGNLA